MGNFLVQPDAEAAVSGLLLCDQKSSAEHRPTCILTITTWAERSDGIAMMLRSTFESKDSVSVEQLCTISFMF